MTKITFGAAPEEPSENTPRMFSVPPPDITEPANTKIVISGIIQASASALLTAFAAGFLCIIPYRCCFNNCLLKHIPYAIGFIVFVFAAAAFSVISMNAVFKEKRRSIKFSDSLYIIALYLGLILLIKICLGLLEPGLTAFIRLIWKNSPTVTYLLTIFPLGNINIIEELGLALWLTVGAYVLPVTFMTNRLSSMSIAPLFFLRNIGRTPFIWISAAAAVAGHGTAVALGNNLFIPYYIPALVFAGAALIICAHFIYCAARVAQYADIFEECLPPR